ncbi:hypothetical protein [Enterobacter phage vB-EclM_KMB17]|nr:hypothetical protein [Enterobacter phage vB-EclM_KMB17]ULA52687.1 hypothetical protein [Enterobacter phage vB-EclM_KMB20]UVD32565.1 hypothetical protein ENTB43_145 [Enterobacter phage Entb_43]
MYCTYLTVYTGNKLPRRYIGSTTVSRINENYHGSVKSKKYKEIWISELRDNPHLFKTRILKTFSSHRDALNEELRVQKKYNVVRSKNYINMSFAQPNGFFGMSKSGYKWTKESINKRSATNTGRKRPNQSVLLTGRKRPNQSKLMTGDGNPMYGKEHPAKGKKINQPRAVCQVCGVESTRSAISRYHKNCNKY